MCLSGGLSGLPGSNVRFLPQVLREVLSYYFFNKFSAPLFSWNSQNVNVSLLDAVQ